MLTKRVKNLTALSLLLALAENFIPRPLPFFRLGLSNISLLIALGRLSAKEYFLLSVFKAVASSYMSGTLISPFFLISLSQSIISASSMFFIKKILNRHISIYGISMTGSFFSTITQLTLASLYLGEGIMSLLSIMLTFSLSASIITAYLSTNLPFDLDSEFAEDGEKTRINKLYCAIVILIILIALTINSPLLLFLSFSLSILASLAEKRRFKALNYIILILISLFSALLTPRGEVLFRIFGLPISSLSLSDGLTNGLKLSLMMALSLTFSRSLAYGGSLSQVMNKFFIMESTFYNAKGRVRERIALALNAKDTGKVSKKDNKVPYFTSIWLLCAIIAIKIIEFSLF